MARRSGVVALSAAASLWAVACGPASQQVGRVEPDDAGRDSGGDSTSGDHQANGVDPGRVSIHRLNNAEYDHTVHDLLGVDGQARTTFQPDERSEFDNDADAFAISADRYEGYLTSAERLAEATFADPLLRARIVTCAP